MKSYLLKGDGFVKLNLRQSYKGNNVYEYELFDGEKSLGKIIKNFDWNSLQINSILKYKGETPTTLKGRGF